MRLISIVFVALLLGLGSGCTEASSVIVTYGVGAPALAPVPVDPQEAARHVSAMRAAAGLGPVTVSATLNAIAAVQADAMARAGVMDHNVAGGFARRLRSGGYAWAVAAENIGAGYRSMEEAFLAWYESPGHRANLLARGVTEIGIASAFNAASPYGNFWALVLGCPR